MLKLTDGDKKFIKLTEAGEMPTAAFRQAYPNHPSVIAYLEAKKGTPERKKFGVFVTDAAKNKLKSQFIKSALTTYQDSMEVYSQLSLKAATDLVVNARSEKVRADLAIEGIRHKIGTPVQKMAIQEKKVVHITFGKPPDEIIEGETVEVDDPDESDYN